jgi:crotonobetainyl-CoA:carnitine CoA-transferase CaiB-like acyl-CoA transferase
MKPLAGLVVLDLSRFLAGPYCTLLLGGLGAEVVKVEPPGEGDPYRARPPLAGPAGASFARRGPDDISVVFLHRARNKKSVTLNLRHPEGVALFGRLCARADVLVENFAPGTLETMGLGFPTLQRFNPRLVLCSMSGFGQDGPRRDWRAYDPIVQAMSGIVAQTGEADGPPLRAGLLLSDTTAALYGVIGILAALRAREATGQGDWVDVSMQDGSFFLMPDAVEFLAAGVAPRRSGNTHAAGAPFNVYPAADGPVSVCAVTERDRAHVLAAIGRPELAREPRFSGGPAMTPQARRELDDLVGAWIAGRPAREAVDTLQAHKVPASPVPGVDELIEDEHLRARGMVVGLEHPRHGLVPGARALGMPIKFRHHPAAFDAPAPALGADNAEVYGRLLGLDAPALDGLRARGIV